MKRGASGWAGGARLQTPVQTCVYDCICVLECKSGRLAIWQPGDEGKVGQQAPPPSAAVARRRPGHLLCARRSTVVVSCALKSQLAPSGLPAAAGRGRGG